MLSEPPYYPNSRDSGSAAFSRLLAVAL